MIALMFALALLVLPPACGPAPAVQSRGDATIGVTPREGLTADELRTIEIFENARQSVVHISPIQSLRVRRGFSFDVTEVPAGHGSGFVWDKQGHIVTNFHVLHNATGAKVRLADQSIYDAEPVAFHPDKDLAVLRIDAPPEKLNPLPVGTSYDLLVGQKVYAIGNPFGLDQSLSTGVVSAVGREIKAPNGRTIQGVIQTDAAINPGNSGGPLLDSAGRLIGVNTMILSTTNASAGVGFAVPVDIVRRVVPDLIEYGEVERAGLGIVISEGLSRNLRLDGVLVTGVADGGSAARAGLRPAYETGDGRIVGDVIVEVDGRRTRDEVDLLDALDGYQVGDRVTLTVRRGDLRSSGETIRVPITLQSLRR